MFISSMITPFSRSISSVSNSELRSMSARTLIAIERSGHGVAGEAGGARRRPAAWRLPAAARGRRTGCGRRFHAAWTGGEAVQALERLLGPRDEDVLVVVSHEGVTPLTLEAARALRGE